MTHKDSRGVPLKVVLPDEDPHTYEEFDLPCPHHVPCASPCQGRAYRRR